LLHEGFKHDRLMPFTNSEQKGEGQAIALTAQMDFGAKAANRSS